MTVQDLSLVPGQGKLVDAVCYGASFSRLQFVLHKILGCGDVLKLLLLSIVCYPSQAAFSR